MRTIKTLAKLMELVDTTDDALYVRYSRGPQVDAKSNYMSRNHLSGNFEAGLSVNRLTPPEDWPGESVEYVIMNVCDYCYLLAQGDRGTRAWVMAATEAGRGSDNELLVEDVTPIAWIETDLIDRLVRYEVAVIDVKDAWRRTPLAERQELRKSGRDIEQQIANIRREMLGF